jgi:hypothetical protein
MPTRKFRELVESMPAERQRRIAKRVRESLASMPLEEIRKARQMTQAKLAQAAEKWVEATACPFPHFPFRDQKRHPTIKWGCNSRLFSLQLLLLQGL